MKKIVYQVPSIKVKKLVTDSLLINASGTSAGGQGSDASFDPTNPDPTGGDAKIGLFDNVVFDY